MEGVFSMSELSTRSIQSVLVITDVCVKWRNLSTILKTIY